MAALKEGDLVTFKLNKYQAYALLKGLTVGFEIMDIIKCEEENG